MSKTFVRFLKKNRRVGTKKIKASEGLLDFEKGYYIVSPNEINKIAKNGKLKKGSEILFFEGNTSPIPVKKPKDGDADPSSDYLDDMVYVNFLEQTGDPRTERFKDAFKIIRPVFTPAGFVKLLIGLMIIGTLLKNLVGGLFV
jgi:hypothetical protein